MEAWLNESISARYSVGGVPAWQAAIAYRLASPDTPLPPSHRSLDTTVLFDVRATAVQLAGQFPLRRRVGATQADRPRGGPTGVPPPLMKPPPLDPQGRGLGFSVCRCSSPWQTRHPPTPPQGPAGPRGSCVVVLQLGNAFFSSACRPCVANFVWPPVGIWVLSNTGLPDFDCQRSGIVLVHVHRKTGTGAHEFEDFLLGFG